MVFELGIKRLAEKQEQDNRITVLGGCISALIFFPIIIGNKLAAVAFLVERLIYVW